jgi:hypothetical protein
MPTELIEVSCKITGFATSTCALLDSARLLGAADAASDIQLNGSDGQVSHAGILLQHVNQNACA